MSTLLPVNNIAHPNLTATTVSNSTLYSTGTGVNWAPAQNYDSVMTVSNTGEKAPTLAVKGDLVINGINLEERLRTIEKVLAIPERDAILEAKHPKLKKLYDEYISALEQYKTWEKLKGDDDAT